MDTACRTILRSGFLVARVNGKCTASHTHPTELTVSHTPTKCGLHSREKVRLKSAATAKSIRLGLIKRIAYGINASLPFGNRPTVCSMPHSARAVYAPRLKPNTKT